MLREELVNRITREEFVAQQCYDVHIAEKQKEAQRRAKAERGNARRGRSRARGRR